MKYYCKVIKPPPESGEARHSCDEMNGRDIAPYRNKKMFKKPVSKNQKLLLPFSAQRLVAHLLPTLQRRDVQDALDVCFLLAFPLLRAI